MSDPQITGYRRSDTAVGVRNHLLLLASVSCANHVVEQLAREHPDIVGVTHQHGCTHLGADREQVLRTLAGTCANPNVGAVLIVGLGCEVTAVEDVAQRVDTDGRMVRTLVIQQAGGAEALYATAEQRLEEMRRFMATQRREPMEYSELTIGLECGGSDPFSGLTANPVIGRVSDRLVEAGGTVILSETPEMIGAEVALADRIPDPEVKAKLFGRIAEYVELSRAAGSDLRGTNPTPGNIRAGLSTIEEKSLGCVIKGGTGEIRAFVNYAERPTTRGLVVMDTPGNDPESLTGMAAGGAQCMLFSTGVGTPLGNPVAPVLKIASNSAVARSMADYIDLDAGRIIEGAELEAVGDALFELLIATCNGQPSAAERNRCREFAVNRIGPTF